VYAAEFAVANVDRLKLKGELGDALTADELALKYLPIIDLSSGLMTGVEALLRWNHPRHGSIPRTTFIPLAEASGDILPIGRWVLTQACAQAGRWQRHVPAGQPPLRLAINVSGRQLTDPKLTSTIRDALADADLDPDLVTLEITESVLLDDETTLAPLLALRELGVHLAIDDFGTGHSALSRLRRFPIDTLKIDKSFVGALTADAPVPDVLITAILALGHGLNMSVVAEGVETEDQLAALRALGCSAAQGFLVARPADPDIISQLIRSNLALTDPVDVSSH
jgi:EAL domain-containing protein (putative c-di-GMP-specific phosphodiesterase class I)